MGCINQRKFQKVRPDRFTLPCSAPVFRRPQSGKGRLKAA
ncbi:hypothetical protein HMPREF9120_02224 [Neisseria sp. oral taxon 020 str. F0370]|nr:hypothetical protein HMPREF9120_02224 [Neisseria sp. oral taxon 020 str. F0370]